MRSYSSCTTSLHARNHVHPCPFVLNAASSTRLRLLCRILAMRPELSCHCIAWLARPKGYFLNDHWKVLVQIHDTPTRIVVVAKSGIYLGSSQASVQCFVERWILLFNTPQEQSIYTILLELRGLGLVCVASTCFACPSFSISIITTLVDI
jgi:hypothetical protein